MRVPSGVNVIVAVFVWVNEGVKVAFGRGVVVGVCEGEVVAVGGGKSRFATGSPNKADAVLNENNANARISHCHPASTYARRVRKNATLRADCMERIPARAASSAPMARSTTMSVTPSPLDINFEIILLVNSEFGSF